MNWNTGLYQHGGTMQQEKNTFISQKEEKGRIGR